MDDCGLNCRFAVLRRQGRVDGGLQLEQRQGEGGHGFVNEGRIRSGHVGNEICKVKKENKNKIKIIIKIIIKQT